MKRHITPALVISLIALTLSLMGVGYAAISLPRDSVGQAQIKPGAVGSSEIANGSLRPADFSRAALVKLEGAQGPKGETGAAGPRGETGAPGAPGGGGPGSGTGLTVTGADGTVAGTLVSSFYFPNSYSYVVRTPTGLIVTYRADNGDQWTPQLPSLNVYSFAPDCSEPRYAASYWAREFPHGTAVVLRSQGGWDWNFTIGPRTITPAVGTNVYYLDSGRTCMPGGTVEPPYYDEWIQLEPTPVPIPVLTTPVTIG